MSGTTANGLPYPTGTDKVRDGDNAIQALADALQLRGHGLRIECRKLTVTTDGNGFAAVIYQKAFASAPVAVAWCMAFGSNPHDSWHLCYDNGNQTAVGCWFFVRNLVDGGSLPNASIDVQYIAIGPN